jgi:hypothetical protein
MYGALTMGSCYMIVAFTLLGARNNPANSVRVCHNPVLLSTNPYLTCHVARRGYNCLFLPVLLLLWYQFREGRMGVQFRSEFSWLAY